jgi:uncharacterized protein VirK/YbjX
LAIGIWKVDRKMSANMGYPITGNQSPVPPTTGARPSPLLTFIAREKNLCSPALLGGVLWRTLTNIRTLRQVLQVFKFPAFFQAARSNPRFAFKYLTPDYLVRGLTVAERASCFTHHYKRMQSTLPDRLLRETLQGDVRLHEICAGRNRFTLTMGLPQPLDKEGEMSLNLRVNGEIVFVLSFAVVPGSVVRSPSAEVVLITQLQGRRGAYRQIYLATKSMHDVAPCAFLLAALQGIATAMGIPCLAAVSATMQTCYTTECAAAFNTAYDGFFQELGMARNAAGFFVSPVPIQDKPLARIKQGHKLRTKQKRAFKQQIQKVCSAFFEQFLPLPSTAPIPTATETAIGFDLMAHQFFCLHNSPLETVAALHFIQSLASDPVQVGQV